MIHKKLIANAVHAELELDLEKAIALIRTPDQSGDLLPAKRMAIQYLVATHIDVTVRLLNDPKVETATQFLLRAKIVQTHGVQFLKKLLQQVNDNPSLGLTIE